jgi:hypothetical protein
VRRSHSPEPAQASRPLPIAEAAAYFRGESLGEGGAEAGPRLRRFRDNILFAWLQGVPKREKGR